MILITSAAYVTPGLISEFGKLPPCMLPVQNCRLYEHQLALISKNEPVILSLPQSFSLSSFDLKRLSELNVVVVKVPDDFSLGQSVVYVLNVLGCYSEPVSILHGDTLFSALTTESDVCAVAVAEDDYDWATASSHDKVVYAGFFTFSNQSLLIQKITEFGYNFIQGVEEYSKIQPLTKVKLDNWMDFGLSNSYYRSISKMTTQRVFNSMKVTRYSVRKSSKDVRKMEAEANWIKSLPSPMKHYAPALWNQGNGFYEIEYYFLPSLANLFVFGRNKAYVWEEIIDACVEFLNDEFHYKPDNVDLIAKQNDYLYGSKTFSRLEAYISQRYISLDKSWIINGIKVPSLREILLEMDSMIRPNDIRFVSLMHGDPCFSNILYDFKSKSIKVIDPRGLDHNGNISIYGDFRYDVAKLSHSILGMYDFIIGGMFELIEHDPYNIELHFEMTEELKKIQAYFSQQIFAGYNINELSTYPILIHLFLSMLPLHNDYPLRQQAMLANALRLYVELKK